MCLIKLILNISKDLWRNRDHTPTDARIDSAIIQLADNLALATDIPFGGKFALPGMEDETIEQLNLSKEDVQEIIDLHDLNIKYLYF